MAVTELVRVSVLGASTQLDVALPAGTPITALVPDLLELLRIPPPPVDDPDRIGELPRWTLSRVGGPPLPAEFSLAEAEVSDGELLLICEDLPTVPGALLDDVVDGLAHLAGEQTPGWSASDARRLGYGVCLGVAVIAAIAGRLTVGNPLLVGSVSGGIAALLVTLACVGPRIGADPRSLSTLGGCGYLAAMLAGSFAPQPNSTGPSLAAAGGCGLVAALLVHRCTGTAPALHACLATVAALTGLTGLMAMALSGDLRDAAAVTAAAGVYTGLLSARLAIAAGRLPLPPVPVTPPPPPSADDDDRLGPIADLALVDLDRLTRQTRVAAGYLTDIVTGASVISAVAVVLVAVGSSGSVISLLFCGAVGIALISRGRTHADRVQSTVLIAAGAASLTAVIIGSGSAVGVFIGGIALAATAFIVGVSADAHEFSPLQRRSLELAEYAVIVAIIPLLLWLLDVYRLVREL